MRDRFGVFVLVPTLVAGVVSASSVASERVSSRQGQPEWRITEIEHFEFHYAG